MKYKTIEASGESFVAKEIEVNEPITSIQAKNYEGFWGIQIHFTDHTPVFVPNGIYFETPINLSLPGKEEGYINGLKELLRMAGCPELLIENPNMLKGQVEAVDHEWALKAIEKYKDRPYIDNAERQ